ncbi:hypothetical protein ASPSYDRAFT_92275 [Aspergillus sydowii CBS 593.65]|uniref:Uncharacterized protein n=1 Tax=Aspergillus sydowii CBS 593.65 TaxID=1036612 RepID=A0A1L9T9V4_9EURO|nr:uncharacterized protein ASPSYDRAFT_92275 [Aspergillus sydowii CBS 593.65]OJJ56083.1 hypothetical protein ASPSYDRAFT_92275 [Aspergillus sydowii CBS 593.65]
MPKPNKKRNRSQFATPDRDPEIQPKLEWTPDHHHGEDQKLASIQLPSSAVHLALSPDEKFTAVVVGENKQSELQIYRIKDSQLVETVQLWSGHVFGLSFAPSLPYHGGYMVAVSKTCEGAMLCYLDHRGRLPENVSPAVDRDALCERLGHDIISILADYHYTQETNETGEFPEGITDTLRKVFDQGQKEHKMPYPLGGDRVVFSTDGTFLITAAMYDPISTSKGAPLVLWDLRTRGVRYNIPCLSNKIWWVAISPDSRFIAFGESDTSVQIWNLETGRFNDPPSLRGMLIRHGVFSPDSAYIALVNRPGDSNASVHIHNLTGGKRVSSLWDVASCSEPTSGNHDGTLLAVLRAQNEISLWNPSADQRPTENGVVSAFSYPRISQAHSIHRPREEVDVYLCFRDD